MRTKLSPADVAAIRARAASGETYRALGIRFGVATSTIRNVVRGVTHPPDGPPSKERRRRLDKRLREKYGISLREYEAIREFQNGRCALCSEEEVETRELPVDHDHVNGLVRGLLCSLCNRQLGWVERIGIAKINAYLAFDRTDIREKEEVNT
jgi:hypothetical protein